MRIRLADGTFGYGRLLELPYVAFYNYRTTEPSVDLETIASQPILFKQAVRTSGLKQWQQIGKRDLEGDAAKPVITFLQDLLDFRDCTIFDSAGAERKASPDECAGIERAAVWEPHGIENRLLDTFMGRPNDEEIRSRVRLK